MENDKNTYEACEFWGIEPTIINELSLNSITAADPSAITTANTFAIPGFHCKSETGTPGVLLNRTSHFLITSYKIRNICTFRFVDIR